MTVQGTGSPVDPHEGSTTNHYQGCKVTSPWGRIQRSMDDEISDAGVSCNQVNISKHFVLQLF